MANNNFLEPNKMTLAEWVDKVLQQSLKKENIKFVFRVCEIWPLNSTTMTSSLVQ